MAGSLASINIKFFADLAQFSSQMQNATRQVKKQGERMQEVGRAMSLAITTPLLGLGAASIKTFGDLQALDKGLVSVMGSSEAAAIEFKKLREVAKLPGLGLEEAVKGSVNLQAAGFSANEAREALLAFGNALATVGKGKAELDLVTLALTQLNNKSGGFGQDLRQLTEQLPQLRGALVAAFGTSNTEMISKSGVTGKQVVQALTKEFAKLPKVTGGINNAFENLSDNTKISLAKFGESINKAFDIEGKLNSLSDAIGNVAEGFSELSPVAQKTILAITGITAAIGPVLLAVGSAIKLLPVLKAGLAGLSIGAGPILAIVAGISAAVVVYKTFFDRTKQLTAAQAAYNREQATLKSVTDAATASIQSQRLYLDQLVVTARNANEPMAKRKAAIEAINKISPEYLGNLTLETIRTDAATTAINKYNEALFKGAMARAAQSKIDENAQKRINAQLKFEQQTYEYNKKKNEAQQKGWDALQEFFKAENANMGMALTRYEDKLKLIAEEDARLLKILDSNKENLKLVESTVGATENLADAMNKLAKAGTIDFYTERIAELEKMKNATAVTREEVEVFEKAIKKLEAARDRLNGKRAEVKGVEIAPVGDLALSTGRQRANDVQAEIDKLKQLQEAYVQTDAQYQILQSQIEAKELEFKIITDPSSLIVLRDELARTTPALDAFQQRMTEFGAQVAQIMKSAAESFAVGFGEILAEVITGTGGLQSIFNLLLTTLADVVIQIGKAAIGVGFAMQAIQQSFAHPATAIAAGVALVAAGSIMKAFVSKLPKFESGGVVGGSSVFGDRNLIRANSGEWILNKLQQEKLKGMLRDGGQAINVVLGGGFELDGAKLRLVLDRTDNLMNRTR